MRPDLNVGFTQATIDADDARALTLRDGAENDLEAGLRRLLELACDWTWALDAQWRLVRLESRHLDAGPHPIQGQLGKPPWEWPGVVVTTAEFAELRTALVQHRRFHELEYSLRDHRGHLRYHGVSGEPDFERGGSFAGYRGTTRDVTHRKRAEALVALEHAVTRNLAEAANSRKILQAVMRLICESEQWETAGFFRVEDESGMTRLIAGWSGPGMDVSVADYYRQATDRVIPKGGPLSQVIATAKPLWVADVKESQTTSAQRVQRTGEHATFFCPVLVDAQVFGVFAFASREFREPDDRLLKTMRVIGEQVGQFLKRKQAEQVLRESEARFRALTDLSSDWYWEIDTDFRLIRVEGHHVGSDDFLPGKNAIGKRLWETGLEMDDAGGWEAHRAMLQARLPVRDVVLTHVCADGTRRHISITGESVHSQRGAFVGYRGVGRDITERKLAEKRIQTLATHDGLTGLPNRGLFSELLAAAVRTAERHGQTFAVLFIDLDHFKVINDTCGHDAGDTLLTEMSLRLSEAVRTSDIVARFGGDEFVVVVQQLEGAADAAKVASKILAAAARPMTLQAREYRVTASVGISLYPVDARDERSLVQHADAAMYAAKQNGRNDFRFYSQEIAKQSSDRLMSQRHLCGARDSAEPFAYHGPGLT